MIGIADVVFGLAGEWLDPCTGNLLMAWRKRWIFQEFLMISCACLQALGLLDGLRSTTAMRVQAP